MELAPKYGLLAGGGVVPSDLSDWSNRPAASGDGYLVPMTGDDASGCWYRSDPYGTGTALADFDEVARFKGDGTSEPVDQGWEEYGNTNNITATAGLVTMDMTGVAPDPTNGNAIRTGTAPTNAANVTLRINSLRSNINSTASYTFGVDVVTVSASKMFRIWAPASKSTWHVGVTSPVNTGIALTTAIDIEVVYRGSDSRGVIWINGSPFTSYDDTFVLHTVGRTNLAYVWQNLASGSTTGQLEFANILCGAIEA